MLAYAKAIELMSKPAIRVTEAEAANDFPSQTRFDSRRFVPPVVPANPRF